MSRISCDVTRDLFTVYLDDICSEESKGLVEEHLLECEMCRQLLEEMKGKDEKEQFHREQVQFLKKTKKYIDNKNRLVFFIALLFATVMALYSDFYYSYVPDIIVYVAIPVLMCTFMLAQPTNSCEGRKYHSLQWASILSVVLLVGLQFFVIWQLSVLLHSPGNAGLLAIFKWEPMRIGPFLEKIYWCFILAEMVLIVLYYLLGKKKHCSLPIGQNVSWLGMALGVMFRASLYRMDTFEGYQQVCMEYMGILIMEFVVAVLFNLLYVKQKNRRKIISGL